MTLEDVKNLHSGDEVFWNDPDDGLTSRVYKIQTIKTLELSDGAIILITEPDGSTMECYAEELS